MSTPENPDPVDLGTEDDVAIDEALAQLTSGMPLTATAEEDEEVLGEDVVGEAEEEDDEDDEQGRRDAAATT